MRLCRSICAATQDQAVCTGPGNDQGGEIAGFLMVYAVNKKARLLETRVNEIHNIMCTEGVGSATANTSPSPFQMHLWNLNIDNLIVQQKQHLPGPPKSLETMCPRFGLNVRLPVHRDVKIRDTSQGRSNPVNFTRSGFGFDPFDESAHILGEVPPFGPDKPVAEINAC